MLNCGGPALALVAYPKTVSTVKRRRNIRMSGEMHWFICARPKQRWMKRWVGEFGSLRPMDYGPDAPKEWFGSETDHV